MYIINAMMTNTISSFNLNIFFLLLLLLLLYFAFGRAAKTKNKVYYEPFKAGDSKTLSCLGSDNGENIKSDRLFEWSHDGSLIQASVQKQQQQRQQQQQQPQQKQTKRITLSRNKAQLKIENLTPSDSGEYACREIVNSANDENATTQRFIIIYNLKLGQ